MAFTSSSYGGGFTQATDLEVNTSVDEVYLTPPQLPFLVNLPYAALTISFGGFYDDNINPYGSTDTAILTLGGTAVINMDDTVTFTFSTTLSSTNYVIKMTNRTVRGDVTTPITSKTTSGFTFKPRLLNGTASVSVFLEGYV